MRHLSGFDASFVYDEQPQEPQHTLKVCFLGEEASRAYNFEKAKEGARAWLGRLPLLRWRIQRIPLDLYHPVWVEDENIDLDHHLHRQRLPDGAGRKELCQAISEIASKPLDPNRPLWEHWWLEGYEGNKVVVVLKVSHALADGGSFVDLFERALFSDPVDDEAIHKLDRELADSAPPAVEHPGRAKLLMLGIRELALDFFVRAPKLALRALVARKRRRKEPDLIPRPTVTEAPHHIWGGPLGPRRAFYFTTVSLPAAKQIAKTFGITINDVVIAVAAGAVRSYLEQRNALPETPVVGSISASIRLPEERGNWGNRVTNRTVRMPTHLADPVERAHYAHTEAAAAKRDIQLQSGAQLAEWVELTPPFMLKLGTKLMRYVMRQMHTGGMMIVSNVRGPTSTLYTTDGPIENLVSVGHVKVVVALNVTVWSYVDKLNFGLYTDGDAFPDLDEMADHIDRAFEELVDTAKEQPVEKQMAT
jgi:diacylglycerol O-acyltransferase / wax synthase